MRRRFADSPTDGTETDTWDRHIGFPQIGFPVRRSRYRCRMPADLEVTCEVCGDGEPGAWEVLPGLCPDCAADASTEPPRE